MTGDTHIQSLGKLWANFHALELGIRFFLGTRPGARDFHETPGVNVLDLPAGTDLPESDLTSFTYFSDLVAEFNRLASVDGTSQIDSLAVDIRNALAHGSVLAKQQTFPVRLLRFSRPKNGRVTLTMNVEMSEEWFDEQHRLVSDSIRVVSDRLKSCLSLDADAAQASTQRRPNLR
jgi:hypothetical protein